MPMPWPLWIGLLVVVNIAGPIYFFEALEAKVVLAAFLASAASMTAIFAAKGFVRLLGIGHIFWIPMVPWLWTRLDQVGAGLGRNSSIRRRISRNKSRGTATSAIWKVTYRPCGRQLPTPASRTSGNGTKRR